VIVSDAKAQSRQRAIDHMARLLQMNPIHQGEEIIRARIEALGLAKKAEGARPAPVEEQRVDRRKMLDALESVRSQFWTLPIDVLNAQLNALDGQGFVDLEAAIKRLRVVAAHRTRFPALAEKPGFDGDLFSSLKEVLIRSPRDTAVVREQVLSTFRNRSRRKQGRQMVALLKSEMPAVYDLEADWFNTLYRQKAQFSKVYLTSARPAFAVTGSESNLRKYRWVIWITLIIVGRFLLSLSDSGNSRSPSVPNIRFPDASRYSPSDLQREFQKAMRSRASSSFNEDKQVWQPYQSPYSPDSREQPDSRPSIGGEDSFPRPLYLNPNGPRKESDGRYSR
jgi:hypothetical protein